MKITYDQFLALVKRADRISCDGTTVDTFNEFEGGINFYWEDADYLGFEVMVDDDKDFSWDASKGMVSFKDSDDLTVIFRFYIEFPLQEIPFTNKD